VAAWEPPDYRLAFFKTGAAEKNVPGYTFMPAIWLRLQAAYDAWHAEREVDVSKIPTLEQA
jgi:hypothetical protein